MTDNSTPKYYLLIANYKKGRLKIGVRYFDFSDDLFIWIRDIYWVTVIRLIIMGLTGTF